MRILSVRFKNLNSLAGSWDIDFTHPAYTSDGIFAITGPTGAGKTTILDAVCLALYGRTPRLNRVTKSTNELMSRLTGECFAEVCFETRSGRYRCHWSQHRARNKADGELQTPRHELCHADTGEIIESRLREVIERIEILTGMDYERFTRSMLLAQGGFAAFLQAPSAERAPILEQITGTEVYSRISVKVHERRIEEARKLEKLTESAAGIKLLTDEARQEMLSNLENRLALEPQLTAKRDIAKKAMLWLESIARQEQDLEKLQAKIMELDQRVEFLKPELEKLEKARRAKELDVAYVRISSKRDDQKRELIELADIQDRLPNAKNNLTNNLDFRNYAQDLLLAAKLKQKQEMVLIKSVRELDINIEHKDQQVKALEKEIRDSERVSNDAENQISDIKIVLEQDRKELGEIQQYLDNNEVDSSLIENLAAIKQIFDNLKDINNQYNTAQDKLTGLAGLIDQGKTELTGLDSEYNEIVLQSREATDRHESILEAIKKLLEDRELEDWRCELDALKDRKSILEELHQSQQKIIETRTSRLETLIQRDRLMGEQYGLKEKIQLDEGQLQQLEREVSHLEIQLGLLKQIQSLEEQRAALEDGRPCPLCGSINHPYAEGKIFIPNETEASLNTAKTELKQLMENLSALRIKRAEIVKDLQQLDDIEAELDMTLIQESRTSTGFLKQLNITGLDDALPDIIAGEMEKIQDQILKHTQLIIEVEGKGKTERQFWQELQQFNKSLTDAEKKRDKCQHDLAMAQNEYSFTEKQAESFKQQYNQALNKASRLVEPYGIDDLTSINWVLHLDNLTERRDKWQRKQAEDKERAKLISTSEIEMLKLQTLHDKLEEELRLKHREREARQDELNQLNLNRQGLLGDKNPDDEEKRLVDAVHDAEDEFEKASDKLRNSEQELKNLQEKITAIAISTQIRAEELAQMEQAWLAYLIRLEFADEADYRNSCLDEPDYIELQNIAENLQRGRLETAALIQDKIIILNNEREKNETDKAYSELEKYFSACEADIGNIRQEIGALKHRLNEDEQARHSQKEIIKSIDLQTRELLRWSDLHDLIGSADGKKYRNFAQGLTFQTMIAYANQQLTKMTDRYLLATDNSEPLGLNVIDNYQAGEARSTKNLSGGESFIVSLALALGLSRMSSQNVRIDSFFLDEGFGSLDEYALDTALETLAGLHQDGKLIGVISHVPALKERISTQIQVIPQTGGRSIIKGPGCKRVIV
jgi:exonuclease SbcC